LSDIFHEVEEEVRRERFEKLWKQYGDYIIAAGAVVIIAIAGYELWTRYEDNQRIKASETLIAAQQLADSGNFVKSTEAFETLAKDAPGGYVTISRLSRAGVLLAQGRRNDALTIYKSVAADDHGPLGSLALVRAGWILADTAPRGELETLLTPLTGPDNAWRHVAGEVFAYADYHAGNVKKAQAEFAALADDKAAPDGLRHRASAMASFLKNGGLANFGTVPPPPAPVAPTVPDPAAPVPPAPAPNGTPPK
jgi:hypothetical protein